MNFNVFIISGILQGIFCLPDASGNEAKPSIVPKSLEWLAFGDIRGHLEPCGCDPRSDLGSVQRLDAYLRRERMLHPNVLLFHLGNDYTPEKSDLAKRKNAAITDAMKLLAPTASLFNHNELLGFKGNVSLPALPYVLSNYVGPLPTGVKDKLEFSDIVVFGFVEPVKGSKNLQGFSASWLKIAASSKTIKNKILLFSGTSGTLKKLSASRVFDTIIASSTVPMDMQFGDEERRDEGKLIAYRDAKQEILMVPVGGQGVIRSPSLQAMAPALPVSSLLDKNKDAPSLLSSTTSNTSANTFTIPSKRTFVKWLDPSEEVGVSSEMNAVIARYRNASSSAMNALIKLRMKDLGSSPYAGAEACQSCHASSYKTWQESKHASALTTIRKPGRDSDPECVSCHVLGFTAKGGFVSEAASPHFANVQCESCHGPRKDHVANPGVKAKIVVKATNSCAECHTPPHSPRFNHSEYWKKIEHK